MFNLENVWHAQECLTKPSKYYANMIFNYMQKMNIIPQIVFETLRLTKSSNLTGGEHFGLQIENQIFSRRAILTKSYSQLWDHRTSFKAQKVMLPSLKCQIFRFLSKFVLFNQLSRKQIYISKIWLCHF